MNKAGFSETHPNERTLVALCNSRLANPEEVEDHVALCEWCLDRVEQIAALIEALRTPAAAIENSKHMTAS